MTVTTVVASVADTAPRAVTVTSPTAKSCGTAMGVPMAPSAVAVTVIGSSPGNVTTTSSPGAKPAPLMIVVVPPATVAGTATIDVS